MSRYYRVNVRAKNTDEEELDNVMNGEFGWDETQDCWEEHYVDKNNVPYIVQCFEGEGTLNGGMSEEEAYNKTLKYYKSINPKVQLEITYTYLEDLPQSTYGGLD